MQLYYPDDGTYWRPYPVNPQSAEFAPAPDDDGGAAPTAEGGTSPQTLAITKGCVVVFGVRIGTCAKNSDNQRENDEFAEAVRRCQNTIGRRLTPSERERLHRMISRLGLTLQEIYELCVDVFGGTDTPWERPRPPRLSPPVGPPKA